MANGILPGEHDWMYGAGGQGGFGTQMGFPAPPPARQPSMYDRALGGLLGVQNYGGMLTPEQVKAAQQRGLLALGTQMMAASGPSPQKQSFGQILAGGLGAGQQATQAYGNDMLQSMLLQTKLQTAGQTTGQKDYRYAVANGYKGTFEDWKRTGTKASSGVQEYEYAKAGGYKGTFEDWKRVASAQAQPTSDVQNWEYFQKLTPEQQKQWMSLQRQPTAPQLAVINGVPTLVDRIQGTATPLTTQEEEIGAAASKKQAEAEASAIGTATGEAKGGVEKKALAAPNVKDILDVAEPLVDVATGSTVGAGADKFAAVFGTSLKGDQATAQLKILQSALMFAQPRMEGPQGVLDVKLYEQAAGELGDPTVPRDRKKAAIKTIRDLQAKYTASGTSGATRPPLSSFQK